MLFFEQQLYSTWRLTRFLHAANDSGWGGDGEEQEQVEDVCKEERGVGATTVIAGSRKTALLPRFQDAPARPSGTGELEIR